VWRLLYSRTAPTLEKRDSRVELDLKKFELLERIRSIPGAQAELQNGTVSYEPVVLIDLLLTEGEGIQWRPE
jgi:hypothetical protein